MSRVSSNKLFHYTKTFENVMSIMENGFFPRCAVEDISFILTELEKEKAKIAIPMVCFCDLPKELQTEHKNTYGNYGISLSKEWGFKKGICPVMYASKGARSVELYNHAFSSFKGILNMRNDSSTYVEEMFGSLVDFTGFMKVYSDERNIYYDEREWRFLVTFYDPNNPRNLNKRRSNRLLGSDLTKANIEKLNLAMEQEYTLNFQVKDIDAILLTNEDEKARLKSWIDESSFEKNLGDGKILMDIEKEKLKNKIQIV